MPRECRSDSVPPGNRGQRLHQVVERPQQRQRGGRPADLVRADQQERIRRVSEREQHAHDQVRREPAPQRSAARGASIGPLRSATSEVIAQAEEQHDRRQHPDHRRDQEHRAQLTPSDSSSAGQQRPERRAEVIHRSVEAERAPALRRRHRVGDHRVARPGANALAGAVDEARRQHVPGQQRRGDAGARERRHARSRRRRAAGAARDRTAGRRTTLSMLASASALPSMRPM